MTAVARPVLLTFAVLGTVAALAVAYLLGGLTGHDDAAYSTVAAEPGGDSLGTVTMTGVGEATGVPDQMTFRVAVTRTADDVATAMDGASATMTRVLGALRRRGVERGDTETTGLSVDPQYAYSSGAPPVLTGYRVRQSASVVVRDLRSGGEVIAAAVRAGGNAVRVSGIALRIGDQDALMARAREAAVDDATGKAVQYAEATGQPLGQVLTVREGRLPGRPQPSGRLTSTYDTRSADALKAVPIRAGRTDLGARVTVVWALAG